MDSVIYRVREENHQRWSIWIFDEAEASKTNAAGKIDIVWPASDEETTHIGPVAVSDTYKGLRLSYVLILLALMQVLERGKRSAKTGDVHGVLHDTYQGIGLVPGEMVPDPSAKNRWKKLGESKYLKAQGHPQHYRCVYSTDNIPGVIRTCMTKLKDVKFTYKKGANLSASEASKIILKSGAVG
jgi:hypothetical protein